MRLYKVCDILGMDKQNDKMMDKDTLYLLSDPKILRYCSSKI